MTVRGKKILGSIMIAVFVMISYIGSTAFAMDNHLNEYVGWLLIASLLYAVLNPSFSREYNNIYIVFILFSVLCILSSLIFGDTMYTFKMLGTVSIVISCSFFGQEKKVLKWHAIIYSVAALILMIDYMSGGMTAGWDTNEICIAGIFSLFWWKIAMESKEKKRAFDYIVLIGFVAFMFYFSFAQSSKSAIISVIMFVIIDWYIGREKTKNKTKKSDVMFFVFLFLPMIMTFIIIALSKSSYANDLNKWFIDVMDKPFFTGREKLWEDVYTSQMAENWIFGHGFNSGMNLHSVYVTMLYNYGIMGVILYFSLIVSVYYYIRNSLDDRIVRAAFIAYESVYILLMFEVRILNVNKINVLPYILLAVAIGRTAYIKNNASAVDAEANNRDFETNGAEFNSVFASRS